MPPKQQAYSLGIDKLAQLLSPGRLQHRLNFRDIAFVITGKGIFTPLYAAAMTFGDHRLRESIIFLFDTRAEISRRLDIPIGKEGMIVFTIDSYLRRHC